MALLKEKNIIIEYLNKILSLDDFNNHEEKFKKVFNYFKKHDVINNKPIIEFLNDLSSTNQMFQQIISICIEKDKEFINNAIKNNVKISPMKKRI